MPTSSRSDSDNFVKYRYQAEREREVLEDSGNIGHRPTAVPFRVYERQFYDVEVTFKANGDVDYHFFPPKGRFDFPFNFRIVGILLEDAALWSVGPNVKTEADYFDRDVAQWFMRAGEDPTRSLGQPTFFVRFQKVGQRMGAEEILIDRFLGRLDTLLKEVSSMSIQGVPISQIYQDVRVNRRRS
jgi:hypothetical protein